MADFEGLLRASISGTNDAYNQARDDFYTVVETLDTAISNLTNARARVAISVIVKGIDGTLLHLVLQRSGTNSVIGSYRIASRGYPIEYGLAVGHNLQTAGLISDRAGIEQHFGEMLANRDSALVLQIAFTLRK